MTEEISDFDVSSAAERRRYLSSQRATVAERLHQGQSACEICTWYSDRLDQLLIAMLDRSLRLAGASNDAGFVVACVGGNGRQQPAPWSDVDLLLVEDVPGDTRLNRALHSFLRDCWDTGLELGHSVRSPADVLRFAAGDIRFATTLIDMRRLAGSHTIFSDLLQRLQRRIFGDRRDMFVRRCVAARREEWLARGDSVNQLEPDVKKSPGGLRDLHLLNWVSFIRHGDSDPSVLLQHGVLRTNELAALHVAKEFLTGIRLHLHCRSSLRQDVLTRELQLEIVRARHPHANDVRDAAAQFMQEYFRRTSPVAEIAQRVSEVPRSATLLARLRSALLPGRTMRGFPVHNGVIRTTSEGLRILHEDGEHILDVFFLAAERKLSLSPDLRLEVARLVTSLPAEPSRQSVKTFRNILRSGEGFPATLRVLYETEMLDWLVPPFAEIRCLMQFNQYHSFTVDEHTLKTIDEAVAFEDDQSPVGSVYRSIRHKATLHLSLLMHDIGKARHGDHCLIGEQLCEEVGSRLQMAENKKKMMEFLVRHHLSMPDLALRRDCTDPALIVEFARLVGSPERLRMLYVLSAADIKAVGPGVWTDWKADLLADLYNRTLEIISGRPWNHLERERLQQVRDHVRNALAPVETELEMKWPEWMNRQLDSMPPFYLMTEDPERIARDLDLIQQLGETDVRLESLYDPETDTVTYRIFAAPKCEDGCFHKITGVLSGLRNNILTALTCTTADGTVVARFVVSDNDFSGVVPSSRQESVGKLVTDVLTGAQTVNNVFRRSSLFQPAGSDKSLVYVEPQICIDNDCSEQHTVIDVFTMDAPGLLHTLALTLYRHELSVKLARIGTNVDQVVDVFYVVDQHGKKMTAPSQLEWIKSDLLEGIHSLQPEGNLSQ